MKEFKFNRNSYYFYQFSMLLVCLLQFVFLQKNLDLVYLKFLPLVVWLVGSMLQKITSKITIDYGNNIFRLSYLRLLFFKSYKEYSLQELEFEHEVGVNYFQMDTYSLDVFYRNNRIARLSSASQGWDFEKWKALRDELESSKEVTS
jgi:hypothetical protein